MDKVLVVGKKRNKIFKFKVAKKVKNRYAESEYRNVVDISNYKELANLFGDLEMMFDAPINKAIDEMRKRKNPFW